MIVGDPSLAINPVSVILEYKALLKKVPANESHLLFPALASSKTGIRSLNKPATYDCVQNQFKALVKEVGLSMDASEFGLHSMRRGGATAAVNAHADKHYFQKQMQVARAPQNIARIAKSCPENISSVVEVSSCFY